jgi:hypothetical protein
VYVLPVVNYEQYEEKQFHLQAIEAADQKLLIQYTAPYFKFGLQLNISEFYWIDRRTLYHMCFDNNYKTTCTSRHSAPFQYGSMSIMAPIWGYKPVNFAISASLTTRFTHGLFLQVSSEYRSETNA